MVLILWITQVIIRMNWFTNAKQLLHLYDQLVMMDILIILLVQQKPLHYIFIQV